MKSVVVTTFDSVRGPTTHFLVTDGFVSEKMKEEISSMISFKADSKDYFIIRIGDITSYNMQFTIKSSISRGNVESLMLSLVTDAFPSKRAERYFLNASGPLITYLQREPLAELVFHLQNDFSDEEYTVVERIYESSLELLQVLLNGYS